MSTDSIPIGIRALAVSFPKVIRSNDYWQQKYPEMVNSQPKRNRRNRPTISSNEENGYSLWSQEVAPYLSDPFHGSVERRVLSESESSWKLQFEAVTEALTAAKLSPTEIDVAIYSAGIFEISDLLGDSTTNLARKLGLNCPVWNLESTCSSALVALQNACALIKAGEYKNALVIVSHFGSNTVPETDTLAWSMGDGVGAFIVDRLESNQGVLASKVVSTANTYDAYSSELSINKLGKPKIVTQTGENASSLAETAVDLVRTCCQEAIAKAGITLAEIDFFVFNTPTAWYANVCTRALGIEPERTINLYPYYGNIGAVFPLANLYHAAKEKKIEANSLVLVYSNGASATAVATIMRWGDVALGKAPAPTISNIDFGVRLQETEREYKSTSTLSKAEVLAVETERRETVIRNYLSEWLADSLEVLPHEIEPEQPLTMYLDSLLAFSLRSRIESDLETRIAVENFFGDNNLDTLTQLILDKLALSTLVTSKLVNNNEESEREILSL